MVSVYPLKIIKKIQETRDSVSLILEPLPKDKEIFRYKPAQFLTFQFSINNKKYLRNYSLSSCPFMDEKLKTTVKRVENGFVSNYIIDNLSEGDVISSRKPLGRFFKPPADLKSKCYYLFAGGSGITPVFSIIKTVLLSDSENQVHLFYSNKSRDFIIYKEELDQWVSKYNKRFHIVHIFSQSPQSLGGEIIGRLNNDHLKMYFKNIKMPDKSNLYYLCGPNGLMETVENFLKEKQVSKAQIQKESFFASSLQKTDTQKLQQQTAATNHTEGTSIPGNTSACSSAREMKSNGDSTSSLIVKGKFSEGEKAKPETIRAIIEGETIEIAASSSIPILEQLLATGHSPPFSCMSGSCMSCLAVLNTGVIAQDERGILEDENIENHEILTCQAKPQSQLVEVDYDN